MSDQAWAVCIATDAFRLCLGIKPRNFTREEVVRWIRLLSRIRLCRRTAMNLCNTNRLRVTVGRHLMAIVPHIRLREWMRLTRFRSNDHGRGTEHNCSLTFGPFWLFVKWRPNGKRSLVEERSNG